METALALQGLSLRDVEERYYQARSAPLVDAAGKNDSVWAVLNDMTTLYRLEQVRRDFVANASHELKTPITAIRGFAETLLDTEDIALEKRLEFLEIILRQTGRLQALIEDLLMLSRLENSRAAAVIPLGPLEVRAVLLAAVQTCERLAADKRITVTVECDATLQTEGNAELLERALVNLLENAVKYSPDDTTVAITGRLEEGLATIRVKDQGPGIPKEHRERIFERFYRVDKARSRQLGGAGLGLAIVKHIVLLHRGQLRVESEAGQGFHVAVDDVGAGYSGLWCIAEIKPDFLKIDMSLVRGINANSVKRALMETLVAFADKTGSKIIAEGIETASELETLVSMGVHYGQGYYLGRPAFPKQPPLLCAQLAGPKKLGALGASRSGRLATTVADIAADALLVSSDTLVIKVERIFQADEGVNSVVVMDKEKPVALIMRHQLYRALSAKYGVALHERRPVFMLMDEKCLTVSGDSPVEYVAKLAMNRPKLNTYDDIVVSGKGEPPKIVSVRKLIDTLAVVQIEMAKGANPLTGLPGNLAIEQEIETRSPRCESFAFIYADLDNFKVYNDKYGFKAGDDVLLLISRVLNWAVQRHGGVNHFVGHIGGDDFVLLVAPEKADRVSTAITSCFGRTVKYQYNEEDRAHQSGRH